MNRLASQLPAMVEQQQKEILAEWLQHQMESGAWRAGRIQESQVRDESTRFLGMFTQALQQGTQYDARSAQWGPVRDMLAELSRSRATQGFSPSQVATFVYSLKQPLFKRIGELLKNDPGALSCCSVGDHDAHRQPWPVHHRDVPADTRIGHCPTAGRTD